MRISVAVGAMVGYPVRSTFSIAREAGFATVELLATPVILRRGARRYVEMAEERGVEIASVHARLHYRNVGLSTKIDSDLESIRFAAEVPSCDCLVLHPPISSSGDLRDVHRWLDALVKLRDLARPTLRLALENRADNHDGLPRQHLDNLERLRIVAGEWGVHVTLDIAHAVSFGIDPVAAIEAVAPRLVNVHLSDARKARYRGGVLNGLLRDHQLPGQGSVDLDAVSAQLNRLGYTGLVTLELSPVSTASYWPWAPVPRLVRARAFMEGVGLSDASGATASAARHRQVR